MEIHPADIDIIRSGENFRIWQIRRRLPRIGALEYALKEMYSSRRVVRARRTRPARPGGGVYFLYIGRHGWAIRRPNRPRAA